VASWINDEVDSDDIDGGTVNIKNDARISKVR
jgi:hypothetical protein